MRQLSCRKASRGGIAERIVRIAHALYEIGGNSRAISLYRTESGKRIARGRRNGRIVESQALLTEVVNPAKVHREIGLIGMKLPSTPNLMLCVPFDQEKLSVNW